MNIQQRPPSPHRRSYQPPDPVPPIEGFYLGSGAYLAGTAGPSIYLHELGHKVAIEALYQNANPSISIQPFAGGATRWNNSGGLSPLGQQLGAEGSRAAVAMAGTAVDALTSVALFAGGYQVQKQHPMVGTAMMTGAGLHTLNSLLYAVDGIGRSMAGNAGHDFVTFQAMTGVPPLACAAVLAGMLPATNVALKAIDKARGQD